MIARWEQGRSTVDELIEARRIERVAPSRELAVILLAQARQHLTTAASAAAADPTAAFQVTYDAARKRSQRFWRTKACARAARAPTRSSCRSPSLSSSRRWARSSATSTGCAVPDMGRSTRHRSTPPISAIDVADALPLAAAIVSIAERVVPSMPVY